MGGGSGGVSSEEEAALSGGAGGGHSRQMVQPVQRPGSWVGLALGVGQRP